MFPVQRGFRRGTVFTRDRRDPLEGAHAGIAGREKLGGLGKIFARDGIADDEQGAQAEEGGVVLVENFPHERVMHLGTAREFGLHPDVLGAAGLAKNQKAETEAREHHRPQGESVRKKSRRAGGGGHALSVS